MVLQQGIVNYHSWNIFSRSWLYPFYPEHLSEAIISHSKRNSPIWSFNNVLWNIILEISFLNLGYTHLSRTSLLSYTNALKKKFPNMVLIQGIVKYHSWNLLLSRTSNLLDIYVWLCHLYRIIFLYRPSLSRNIIFSWASIHLYRLILCLKTFLSQTSL